MVQRRPRVRHRRYAPSNSGPLPATVPGAVLSLADRLDLLAGMVAIGNAPTGSSDAFGVRRAATGVVNLLRGVGELGQLSISAGVDAAAEQFAAQGLEVPDDLVGQTVAVAVRRYELQLLTPATTTGTSGRACQGRPPRGRGPRPGRAGSAER